MKASEQINDDAITPAAEATEVMQVDDVIASTSTLDCIDIDYVRTPIIKDIVISNYSRFTTKFIITQNLKNFAVSNSAVVSNIQFALGKRGVLRSEAHDLK
ncbi:hypothetical protein EVAR_46222_1 [Eumeta japonica]|uniref:Uncharacterized protein n=1 Tax=Eumeta variegata TaxID=151549 RepID=A0A4C1XLX2_EUMVA|nr:hypothetical protein EVAR_46222_1 [Eumeta japonica]